jgi:DNA-binding SARP family transcriptional activator/tetratricopeptide (TPR) repeat protein
MRYGILGSLELNLDGRPIKVAGAKQRALLAMLLLNANRIVSSDRLIDAVWEDEAPDTARKALQMHVSQLRKLLGRQRLETSAPGYVLWVEPDALDLARFDRLREEGRLDEALALWRGPPLAEFAYQRFARAEIARLEELYLVCVDERIDRDLVRGRQAELVGELEGLVREHPLREQTRHHLMLALYRAGRQAEALDAYQQARAALVEELGIEPGRSLRELHQAILNQDPALDLAVDEGSERTESHVVDRPPPAQPGISPDVRKTVTALYVGIAISNAPGERLDPEALRRISGNAFGKVEVAVEQHGGTIETVASDAVMAIFGLPLVHEDDALRSVRAAVGVREALRLFAAEIAAERPLELEFRIGISTGEVVTAAAAGPRARTTGEPLRTSSRLGQAAKNAEILFDDGVWRLVRDAVIAEATNDAWRLLQVADPGSGSARRLVSPMVGRGRERRRLQDAFDQAVGDQSCQLFTVLGLAGVGKSRLVHEFLQGVSGQARIARGRCLPYGEGITYWPLLEAVNEAVGRVDTDSADEVRVRLLAALAGEPAAELTAQRVAAMIGLAEVAAGAEEAFVAVRSLFEALARVEPLVLVFDDIHWGEPTFLDLVEHLADWARDAPVLLVCLARPELLSARPGWGGGKLNATVALLERLSDEECSQLIENLVGQAQLADEVATRIAEAAEGNPLFVEEVLSMLIDDGSLVRENGRWTATEDISAVRVPPTIQALLAARLDQLDENERSVIERAAVAGKVFQEDAVVELGPVAGLRAVAEALGSLVRKELIRPERISLGERTFRFRHLLIRDAAYESIAKEARAVLHERFGRWLERTATAFEHDEVIGYHLEQAYGYRLELGAVDDAARSIASEAAERLGSAGRRAFVRSDAPAGTNLIARAAALLPPEDPLRVELVPNVRVVQGLGGDVRWADRVLTEAVEAAATTGDRQLAAHALVQRGLLRLFTESQVTADELIEAADRSIVVFTEYHDELGLARAWRLKAQAHYLARRAHACAEASERAFKHVRMTDDRFEEHEIVEWLVIALLLGPTPVTEATECCKRLLRESSGEPLAKAEVLAVLAPLEAMQGHTREAEKLTGQVQTIMDDLGEHKWLFSFWNSFICSWRNDPAAAERIVRPAYDALKKIGEKSHFSSMSHALANAVYLQGRYDEAEHLTFECENASRPNDVHAQILWRSIRAKVMARRGDHEAAEQLAHEAVALAADSDFQPAHADALLDLAEVHFLRGRSIDAANAIEEAIHLYELKGNHLMADHARTLLPS